MSIGLDKYGDQINIFLNSPQKTYVVGNSLEVPLLSASTCKVYPQLVFSWRNKKEIDIFGLKKASCQEL